MLVRESARPRPAPSRRSALWVGLAAVVWVAGLCVAGRALWAYSATPGEAGAPPATWPAALGKLRSDVPTLVMVAHPHCPCTRASMSELRWLMTNLEGRLAAYVFVVQPRAGDGDDEEWQGSEIARSASAIAGVTLVADKGGEAATLLHAATSGQVMLYGRDGRLLFAGGITGARGHEGDNAGRDRVVALVDGSSTDKATSLVFGCSLGGPGEWAARGRPDGER